MVTAAPTVASTVAPMVAMEGPVVVAVAMGNKKEPTQEKKYLKSRDGDHSLFITKYYLKVTSSICSNFATLKLSVRSSFTFGDGQQ